MNLTDQPAEIFIQQLTYLPFKDVISACQTNQRSLNYCTNPRYNMLWKRLIDSAFSDIYYYSDKLFEIWKSLNVVPDTYNYLVYTNLIKFLDPLTQLRIYFKQGDMESFNSKDFTDNQRILAYFLLGDKKNVEKHTSTKYYMMYLDVMNNKKVGQKDLNNMLIDMTNQGSILGVSMLLAKGADVHADNDWPLQIASGNGHLDLVKYLIKRGADIHGDDDYALVNAVSNNKIDVVKYLVDMGANIETDDNGPVRLASINGYLDILRFLVENGADVVEDEWPFMNAVKNCELETAEYLASVGAYVYYSPSQIKNIRIQCDDDMADFLEELMKETQSGQN